MVKISINLDGTLKVEIKKMIGETEMMWDFFIASTSEDSVGPIIIEGDEITIP